MLNLCWPHNKAIVGFTDKWASGLWEERWVEKLGQSMVARWVRGGMVDECVGTSLEASAGLGGVLVCEVRCYA